jgi:hypothetical protein
MVKVNKDDVFMISFCSNWTETLYGGPEWISIFRFVQINKGPEERFPESSSSRRSDK